MWIQVINYAVGILHLISKTYFLHGGRKDKDLEVLREEFDEVSSEWPNTYVHLVLCVLYGWSEDKVIGVRFNERVIHKYILEIQCNGLSLLSLLREYLRRSVLFFLADVLQPPNYKIYL